MSENTKFRRGRIRRNVTALVSAVALACGTAVFTVPSAGAYIQDDSLTTKFGDDLGQGPEVAMELLPEREIRLGEGKYAEIRVDAKAPFPVGRGIDGESDVTAITFGIQLDPLMIAQPPKPQDFKWDDGHEREFHRTWIKDEMLYVEFSAQDFALGPTPGFTLQLPFTLEQGAKVGDELEFVVAAGVDIRPNLDWENLESDMTGNDGCVREATVKMGFENPGNYGTWMADLWLGTNSPQFQLEGAPSFEVVGPTGELTQGVFPRENYPVVTVNPDGVPENGSVIDRDYTWLKKFDWHLNDSEFAGDIWIPAGSTLNVKQNVRSLDCRFNKEIDEFRVHVESRNAPLYSEVEKTSKIRVVDQYSPTDPTTTTTQPSSTTSTPEGVRFFVCGGLVYK